MEKDTELTAKREQQWEDIKNALLSHHQRMETDPEERARFEKMKAAILKLFPPHDNEP